GFNTGALSNLNLNTAQSAPVQTTTGNVILNLPSNAAVPTQAPFNPTNPNTYSQSTSTTAYDSLGNSYPATFYFSQTATPGTWDVNMTVNGTVVAATPPTLTFNFGNTTQFGTSFGVNTITQNGFTTGQLSTVSVDSTGVVSAVYTNGRS